MPKKSTIKRLRTRKLIEEETGLIRSLIGFSGFEAMFNSIPIGVIFVDTERRIVMTNPALKTLLGYSDEELTGHTTEMFYANKKDFAEQGRQRYRKGSGTSTEPYEVKYRRKDGSVFLSETQGTQVKDANGTIIGFFAMIQDITERKQSEAKLRDSESLLVEAQRLSHLGSWDLDLATGKAIWSEELYRLLGYEPYAIEANPDNFLARIHPEDKAYIMRELERPFQGKNQEYQAEFRIVQPNNRVRIVAERGRLIYDEQGKAQRYVGTTLDITERKQTEEALRNSEQELSTILKTMQDTYYRTDMNGCITRVSPSVQQLLGFSPNELLHTQLVNLYVDPEGEEKFLLAMKEADGKLQNYEAKLRHKDGSVVWVSTNAQYFRDEQGVIIGVEGTVRDVSLIKSAEDLSSRFGRILDHSSNEIYIFDVENNHFTLVNRGARQNLDYTMQEMEQLTPLDLKPDYTKESFQELLQPLLKGEQEEIIFQTRHLRKNGSLYPVEVRLQLSLQESPPVFVAIIQDITKRLQTEERLQYLAHHDVLTTLPNRVLFTDRLDQSIARARRHNRAVAVLFLDLDRFKLINDTLGHDFGDRALQALSERLTDCVRDGDTVARLGGDEFAIALEDIASADDVAPTARKILDALAQSFMLDEREFFITTSIGISLFPVDGKNAQTLLKHADIAMYRAKDHGRNTYQFYSSDMSTKTFERLSLETNLRHALEREEFVLHYQPQLDLQTGKVTGMEALIRWQHPDLGLIMPLDFIPLLEDTGLIIPVGEWVLRTACSEAQAWNKTELKPIRVAVNLSSRQFNEPDFTEMVGNILKETGLKSSLLELEITETVLMQNAIATVKTLEALNEIGVRFAIDDFGTGYSSLSYLKRFPIDTLKIDQTFIRDMIEDPDDAILVEAIIALGRALHLNIIAEGVETEAHINFLKRYRCDCIQGYVFHQPLPSQELLKRLKKENQYA